MTYEQQADFIRAACLGALSALHANVSQETVADARGLLAAALVRTTRHITAEQEYALRAILMDAEPPSAVCA